MNGKVYVGQTVRTLGERIKAHMARVNAGSEDILHKAIREFGKDAFDIELIETVDTLEALNVLERHYIRILNSRVPHGYNVDSGGKNHHKKDETRKKLSESLKRRWKENPEKEFKLTIEKAHAATRGKKPHNFGKTASDETRRRLSESHMGQIAWNKGITYPDQLRSKLKGIMASKYGNKVFCPELNKTYESVRECSRQVKIAPIQIRRLMKRGTSQNGLSFIAFTPSQELPEPAKESRKADSPYLFDRAARPRPFLDPFELEKQMLDCLQMTIKSPESSQESLSNPKADP